MATSRRKVRSLTDLNAKQTLQKLDGNDVVFEASGSIASGKVLAAAAFTASAGAVVSGAAGLTVQQGGVTITSGDLKLSSAGLIKNSSGTTVITVDGSGNTTINGALKLGDDRIRGNTGADLIITTNDQVKINSGGLQVTGSTTTSGSLTVGGNGDLTVARNATVNGSLVVEGDMTVRGTPTIISTNVLEVKDNIIVVNKPSGSDDAFVSASGGIYVNLGNSNTASILWTSASNDWSVNKTIAGTTSVADFSVNKLKASLISGSGGVAINSNLTIAGTASLYTSASFPNLSIATSSATVEGVTYSVVNLDAILHAIDSALANAGISPATITSSVQSSYRALRFQYSGTLDANGEALVELPATQESGRAAFPTTAFNYITTDVMVDDGGRWVNDLVAVDMEVSASKVWVSISAAAAANTGYRLVAVNEQTSSFLLS